MLPRKMLSKVFVYNKLCIGTPRKEDIKITERQLKPLKDGEFLAEAVFISVEPFSPMLSENFEKDGIVQGFQVAKVVESKNKQVPAGKYIVGDFGCRTHTISTLAENSLFPWVLPDIGKQPLSLALGVLGGPGITAYFVLHEICKPKQDETLVISGASGVIGSISGQLAKRTGCKVVGITSSDDKGKWLKDTLGFDHYINHKTDNLSALLDKYAPNGVDMYIDNVGGEISSTVIYKLNKFARIAVCGIIQQPDSVKAIEIQTPIKIKHAKMEGILASRWKDGWMEGMKNNLRLLNENKLTYVENVLEGFDKVPEAMELASINIHLGKNVIKL